MVGVKKISPQVLSMQNLQKNFLHFLIKKRESYKTGAFSTHLDALSTTQKEEEIRRNFFGGIGRTHRDDFGDFFGMILIYLLYDKIMYNKRSM